MKNKKIFMLSLIIIIVALLCMGINWFILPLPDNAVRLTGVIILIDLFILTYSRTKLKNNNH